MIELDDIIIKPKEQLIQIRKNQKVLWSFIVLNLAVSITILIFLIQNIK